MIDIKERFWSKVDKSGDCWNWIASCNPNGYGKLYIKKGYNSLAHRYSWEIHNGSIPKKLWVLHKCDNKTCVNPSHLFLGTPKDNSNDRDKKGRANIMVGESRHNNKLTNEQVLFIKYSNIKGIELSKQFHVCHSSISKIKSNKTWKHIK